MTNDDDIYIIIFFLLLRNNHFEGGGGGGGKGIALSPAPHPLLYSDQLLEKRATTTERIVIFNLVFF